MKNHYLNAIYEAILESEIQESKEVDYKRLNEKLVVIMQSAMNDGLSEDAFLQLVHTQLPEACENLKQTPLNNRKIA